MIEGVSVAIYGGICDYDELLREAVPVALRIDTNPTDDFNADPAPEVPPTRTIGALVVMTEQTPISVSVTTRTLLAGLPIGRSPPRAQAVVVNHLL